MTAKQIADTLKPEVGGETRKMIEELINEHALYIAEQAVEEVIWDHRHVISTCDSILSIVETLTLTKREPKAIGE